MEFKSKFWLSIAYYAVFFGIIELIVLRASQGTSSTLEDFVPLIPLIGASFIGFYVFKDEKEVNFIKLGLTLSAILSVLTMSIGYYLLPAFSTGDILALPWIISFSSLSSFTLPLFLFLIAFNFPFILKSYQEDLNKLSSFKSKMILAALIFAYLFLTGFGFITSDARTAIIYFFILIISAYLLSSFTVFYLKRNFGKINFTKIFLLFIILTILYAVLIFISQYIINATGLIPLLPSSAA